VSERLAPGMNLQSRKMGMHEWSYANDYSPGRAALMPHVSLKERFKEAQHRSRARLHGGAGWSRKCSAASTATSRPCLPPSCA